MRTPALFDFPLMLIVFRCFAQNATETKGAIGGAVFTKYAAEGRSGFTAARVTPRGAALAMPSTDRRHTQRQVCSGMPGRAQTGVVTKRR